jgi:hypothetical protein
MTSSETNGVQSTDNTDEIGTTIDRQSVQRLGRLLGLLWTRARLGMRGHPMHSIRIISAMRARAYATSVQVKRRPHTIVYPLARYFSVSSTLWNHPLDALQPPVVQLASRDPHRGVGGRRRPEVGGHKIITHSVASRCCPAMHH